MSKDTAHPQEGHVDSVYAMSSIGDGPKQRCKHWYPQHHAQHPRQVFLRKTRRVSSTKVAALP